MPKPTFLRYFSSTTLTLHPLHFHVVQLILKLTYTEITLLTIFLFVRVAKILKDGALQEKRYQSIITLSSRSHQARAVVTSSLLQESQVTTLRQSWPIRGSASPLRAVAIWLHECHQIDPFNTTSLGKLRVVGDCFSIGAH